MPVKANNIYVGARYIPRIMGEYSNETAYEALDIVTSEGVGYISRQPVPAGTAVTNEEYWAMWGSGNAAIDALTQRVATNENDISELETDLQQTKQNLQTTNQNLQTTKQNLQTTNQNLQTTNQNLQTTNQNLQTTNQNLENLVIPWKPASTLKGDEITDNTAAFGQLDANTPVSLMPGSYLISDNVTIPCAVQFLPGAKLVYYTTTPRTNYCTVTFSKGFVEYGTQIFDTYIIPHVGSQNAIPEINPTWYGVVELQNAINNDRALTWILSSTMGAKRVNFAPGTYTFSNISQEAYFSAQEGAEIIGNGAVFNGAITVPNITFKGVTFTGAISANRGTFKECTFNDGSSISSIYGNLKVIDCKFNWTADMIVSTMGTDGYTLIEKCTINCNATNLDTPFSLSDNNTNIIKDCVFNDLMSETSMPHFSIELSTTSNSRVVGCYMPTGKIVCACAENNLCYMLTADNAFSNMVGGSYQPENKTITGYALTGSNTTLSKGSSTPMQLELIKVYSDGTYENVGAPTEANVKVIGNNSEQTIYNESGTLRIGSDETAKAIMLTYSGSNSNNMIASMVITITYGPVG